jgi:aspartate 1-decarboxylase
MSFSRSLLKSKLHRATVTEADVNYEGSLTLDRLLLEAADILPYEDVHVWNVTRGTRFRTYAMEGEAGSGVVCVNGAAAHLACPGDLIIVATYILIDDASARHYRPRIVLIGPNNRIKDAHYTEIAGPKRRFPAPLSEPDPSP